MTDQTTTAADDTLRVRIGRILGAGLKVEVWPRAETPDMVSDIIHRLRTEAGDDLERKLVIAGFTDHTVEVEEVGQACETCMYYLVHRRFCELPELMLPVEAEWSCRLWRI